MVSLVCGLIFVVACDERVLFDEVGVVIDMKGSLLEEICWCVSVTIMDGVENGNDTFDIIDVVLGGGGGGGKVISDSLKVEIRSADECGDGEVVGFRSHVCEESIVFEDGRCLGVYGKVLRSEMVSCNSCENEACL